MKKLTMLLLAVACYAEPEARVQSSNPELKAERLGIIEDCIVYRFLDSGYHYFVRCPEGVETESTIQQGKSSRHEFIPTIKK